MLKELSEKAANNNNGRGTIDYRKCPMKFYEHIAVFALFVIIGTAIFYVFYHSIFISLIIALAVAPFLETSYANGRIRTRRKKLRVQFCDMLESMSVASRAGNNEFNALEAALNDLKLTYSDDSDIVIEVETILKKYQNGGIQLRVLFNDFGERSGVDDIISFAQIFEVIEGKSNKFSEIIKQTYSDDSDIVIEVETILKKYQNGGIQLRVLFNDFGERSGVDDIISFAQIFEVIEGKSNKFSEIIKQTQLVISDKIEIEQEIETVLAAPKQETAIMLIMPVLLMLLFSADGENGMMGLLFTTTFGRILTTVCIIIFIASYFMAQKLTDIKL